LLGGPLAGIVTKGAADLVLDSPVADGRQEELAQQARARMVPVTDTVRDAVNNMQPPPQYQPPEVRDYQQQGSPVGGASDGGAVRPPTIAPPAHSQSVSSGNGASVDAAPPSVYVPPGNGSFGSGGAGGPDSPALEAVLTPAPPAVRPPDILHPVVTPGDGTPIGGVPPVPPGVPPSTSFAAGPKAAGPLARGAGGRVAGPNAIGSPAVAPGVIGAPGAGTAGSRIGAASPGRVNPVGGVIGGTGNGGTGTARVAPSSTTARAGSGMMAAGQTGMPGVNGRRAESGAEERSGRRWDPDNPWETSEGVAPVIEADPIGRIDPGPGIFGMDR
jgi:hypothetical protein